MNDGLKQRIIGAVVLLALAVIFVPVIFDKERITPVDRNTQIPIMPPDIANTDAAILIAKQAEVRQKEREQISNSKQHKKNDANVLDSEFSSPQKQAVITEAEKNNTLAEKETIDPNGTNIDDATGADEGVDVADINAAKTIRDKVKAPDKIFIPNDKQPENLDSEAPSLDENGVAKAWVLQVASYQSLARAEKIRDELIAKGYMSFTKVIKTNTGQTTRVYVGPSLVKDSLIEAKTVIESDYKINTMLLRFKP